MAAVLLKIGTWKIIELFERVFTTPLVPLLNLDIKECFFKKVGKCKEPIKFKLVIP